MVPPASGGAQTFSDSPYSDFSNAMDQTYDGEDEAPVYRSLCVAAPLAPPMLGGYQPDMAMGLMGGQSEFYSQTKSMASTPSDQDSFPPVQLSGVPISTSFLDPCHVFTVGQPDQIAKQLSEELSAHDVDFVFKSQKGKWKCVAYEFGQHIDFRVRLYATQGSQGFPLEFQRRQGPLLQFNKIYQSIVFKLSQAGLIRDAVSRPSRPFTPPDLALASQEVINEGVGRLVQMADSAQADVQHQAVVTLTKLSTKAEYKAALMNRAAVETMTRLLLEKDAHVRRCAVTVLSDLVDGVGQNERQVAEFLGIGQQAGQQVLAALYALAVGASESVDMETRRQACRLLAGLARPCHAQLLAAAQAQGYQAVVGLVSSCDGERDVRLRRHLADMRETFKAEGVLGF